jgi:hypothetical protein
VASED